MAAINDLINQIQDDVLRNRIQEEVNKMAKQKKFGLVFEEHLPESTPLYDMPINRGCNVMLRNSKDDKSIYVVLKIDGDTAVCAKREQQDETVTFALSDIVRIAEFGESIYPYLKPLDSVCNAPDSDLWHTLIEADNYHALQLLEYLYAGKVDCIYIDPPYNTGAKDWKYNNDYVDGTDVYRHSKWLSMMEKRLKLAKKLLNPNDSTLIVTIDEKEYLHLGCLLEELFPEAQMQMVSITINPSGAVRKNLFARSDEYAFILLFGDAHVIQPKGEGDEIEVRWWYLRRLEYESRRGTVKGGIAQFYPIYIDEKSEKIIKIGEPLPHSQDRNTVPDIAGAVAVFPVRDDGVEMNWGVTGPTLQRLIDEKVVRVQKNKTSSYQPYTIKYLSENFKEKIESGRWAVRGYHEDGSKIVVETGGKITRTTTVWKETRYDAKTYGTVLLKGMVKDSRFSFPKSLYSVADSLRYFVAEKPEALILDFFAGSGTTLQAVNLLNAEDGGHRKCILVTNNEVSETEAKILADKGFKPGDNEWNELGIARHVTWARTRCNILGIDVDGQQLKGKYLEIDRPMAEGFKANAAFFQLSFLDKTSVALGMSFPNLLPLLWLKTGGVGKCPVVCSTFSDDMIILPENRFAVLLNESAFSKFQTELMNVSDVETVFLSTDFEVNYRSMVKNLNVEHTYQLYRDYLDHFRLNRGRS